MQANANIKKHGLFGFGKRILTCARMLRVHQWLKNGLLFVPLLLSHQFSNVNLWHGLIIAFIAFSLCASAVYIINDILDIESDRAHPRKCKRPFASGEVPIWVGVLLAPVLLLTSVVLAHQVGGTFFSWMLFYFGVTLAYSWKLKNIMLVDCVLLAMLYTLRIIAGGSIGTVGSSFWLLAFSVFIFLSLAFVKRYAELQVLALAGKEKNTRRGYFVSDAPMIQMLGIASGFAAAVVLALYLNSEKIVVLYRMPILIWGVIPIFIFWISWVWMKAHRGEMHDDPLIFAIKDKASLLSGIAFVCVLMLGTVGITW